MTFPGNSVSQCLSRLEMLFCGSMTQRRGREAGKEEEKRLAFNFEIWEGRLNIISLEFHHKLLRRGWSEASDSGDTESMQNPRLAESADSHTTVIK